MFTDVFLIIIKIRVGALRNKPWFSWEPLKEMSHCLLPDPHGTVLLSSEENLCHSSMLFSGMSITLLDARDSG